MRRCCHLRHHIGTHSPHSTRSTVCYDDLMAWGGGVVCHTVFQLPAFHLPTEQQVRWFGCCLSRTLPAEHAAVVGCVAPTALDTAAITASTAGVGAPAAAGANQAHFCRHQYATHAVSKVSCSVLPIQCSACQYATATTTMQRLPFTDCLLLAWSVHCAHAVPMLLSLP